MGTCRLHVAGLTVVGGLGLGGRDHAELAVQPSAVVPPVDVLEQRELELLDGAPRPVPFDQLGLELPDRRLGEGVVVLMRPLQAAYKLPEQRVLGLLSQAALDPAEAKRLLLLSRKKSPTLAAIQDLLPYTSTPMSAGLLGLSQ